MMFLRHIFKNGHMYRTYCRRSIDMLPKYIEVQHPRYTPILNINEMKELVSSKMIMYVNGMPIVYTAIHNSVLMLEYSDIAFLSYSTISSILTIMYFSKIGGICEKNMAITNISNLHSALYCYGVIMAMGIIF